MRQGGVSDTRCMCECVCETTGKERDKTQVMNRPGRVCLRIGECGAGTHTRPPQRLQQSFHVYKMRKRGRVGQRPA